MRATRKAGKIPRTTSNDSAYNNIAADIKRGVRNARAARQRCSHWDSLGEMAKNSVSRSLATKVMRTSTAHQFLMKELRIGPAGIVGLLIE